MGSVSSSDIKHLEVLCPISLSFYRKMLKLYLSICTRIEKEIMV